MDEDGLPLVGPGVDYTKVESISQKRTIAFLNHFITHTASFLNRFSNVCEEKLETISNRIQQLEINMNILEAKLSSIPGLENVTAPVSSQSTTSGTTPAPSTETTTNTQPPQTTQAPQAPPAPDEALPPPPPEEPQQSNPVSKDPRYAKYFKLINVGVPPQAIKNKMVLEGLDPNYLDTPDAPAPPADQKKKESDDDFSDSSNNDSDSDFD